jgi:hypothetical protein
VRVGAVAVRRVQPRISQFALRVAGPAVHLRAAAAPWLLAHAIVLAALGVVAVVNGGLPNTGTVPAAGLLAWDGGWYQRISEQGYLAAGEDSIRFFPLLPVIARAAVLVTGVPAAALLVSLSWLAAFAFGALVHALTLAETGDADAARRATWLVQLVPGANVLVLGYTEALAGLLAAGFFLALRHRPGPSLVPLGVLSGLIRPTGVLLAVPALVEAMLRGDRRWWKFAGALAPLVGTAAYLAWCAVQFGDPLLPYRIQAQPGLRGGVATNPLEYLPDSPRAGLPWPITATLIATALGLLWICMRRLPAGYTAWAACLVAAALTAAHFQSLPRYLAAAFPLAMAAAVACGRPAVWRAVLGVSLAGFGALAVMSTLGRYVP